MTGADKTARQSTPEETGSAAHDAAGEATADAPREPAPDEAGAPAGGPGWEAVVGALQLELEQLRDARLRDAAEMENLRRRTAREVADAKRFAISGFARDLLSVSDNLTRALTAVGADERAAASDVWRNLLEGIEMTERELLSVLDRNGVKRLDPRGEKFDPNLHQAIFEVPDASRPAGLVVEVVAPGFMIGERVLRPAMVGVSKGGPRADVTVERRAEAASEARPGETVDREA